MADGHIGFGKDGDSMHRLKKFWSEVERGLLPESIWPHGDVGTTGTAKTDSNARDNRADGCRHDRAAHGRRARPEGQRDVRRDSGLVEPHSAVAAVDGSSPVTARGKGTATVTATAGSASESTAVTVVENPDRAAQMALCKATEGPNRVDSENRQDRSSRFDIPRHLPARAARESGRERCEKAVPRRVVGHEEQLPGHLGIDRIRQQSQAISQLRYRRLRMKKQSSMLHVRMDTEMKREATSALAAMGMKASEAVRLFFHRIVVDQAFPLELKVPNARTRQAMAESEEMLRRGTARFAGADEMFAELEKVGGP